MSVVCPLLTVHTTEPSSFLEYRGSDRVVRKRRHLNMEVSLWRMGKMTRYLNMSDLLLQDHFLFSLPALPGDFDT